APEPWNCGFTDVGTWLPSGGDAYLDSPRLAKGKSREPAAIKGYTNEIFGTEAANFLRSPRAKDKPFFLWLALTAPHSPLTPNPPEIAGLYAGKTDRQLWPPSLPPDATPARLADYCAAVSMADRQLDHVLSALDDAGFAEDTLVIFIGDNGWMLGDRLIGDKRFHGKVYPYEASVRVPFLVRRGGRRAARGPSDACVSTLDLPVTILKAAGIVPPPAWPGRDINPLLVEADAPAPAPTFEAAFCEFPDSDNRKFEDVDYRLIRTRKHKLIVWGNGKRANELYDLEKDPHEQHNLVNHPEYQKVRQELWEQLRSWMRKTNDAAVEWPQGPAKWEPKAASGTSVGRGVEKSVP
ncbi:MAG TPA: sulfatase-like hydrolase/transferase, partial [Planctomycetaceae bacterium]|nr:sulfatase-like hydrolase/transferase [Planctomycetaceae bacterium]